MRGRLLRGFTYTELLVVLVIIISLFSLASINVVPLQRRTNLATVAQLLTTDLRSQQSEAMVSGDWGVAIATASYTLFSGDTYNPADPDNYQVSLNEGFALDSTFASDIVFNAGSGEVANFVAGQNTITITDSEINEAVTLELNRYGVVEAL